MRSAGLALAALVTVVSLLAASQQIDPAEIQLQAAINQATVDGDLKGAIVAFQKIVNTGGVSRPLLAKALLHLGQCHEKLGTAEARKSYERVLTDFGDQPEAVREARKRLAMLAASGSPGEDPMQGRPIVGPSYHSKGGLSPDGRYLAYCCLVVHEIATGREQKIPVDMATPPRFSPDSEEIAYLKDRAGEAPELRVVKRSGAEDRLVFSAPNVKELSLFDWMPDGNHLLVRLVRDDKTTELALVEAAGGSPQRVRSPAPSLPGGEEGSLSRDGKYFAYRASAGGTAGRWTTRVLALDGSVDAPLVERPANAWNIGWTGDGRFAFYSAEAGSEGIWTIKVAAGRAEGPVERVGAMLDDSIRPIGLTAGGTFFYFKNILDLQVHLMMISPASGALKPAQRLGASQAPDWSSDGHYLAYAQSGSGIVNIRTVATGATRTLWTGLPGAVMALTWFPDGLALAAQGVGPDATGASVGLRRVDLASGSLSDILVGPGWRQFGANASLSAGGRVITYKTYEAGQVTKLVRYNVDTREQEVLLERKPPVYISAFSVLPRTGQLAVAFQETDKGSVLALLDPSSRELRPIHETVRGDFIPANNAVAWMPDGNGLFFVTAPGRTKGTPMSLFRIPVTGGRPEKLFQADTIFQVRVHPSGTQVAIETRSFKMETRAVEILPALK
jgi:Tol biopolymer transport system component